MKAINTLIKIKQKEIEESKVYVVQLEYELDSLHNAIAKMEAELEVEQGFVNQNPDFAYAFSAYFNKYNISVSNIKIKEEQIKLDLEILKDKILTYFAELKRFEIIRDNKLKIAQELEAKQLNLMFDDISLTSHMRKAKEDE